MQAIQIINANKPNEAYAKVPLKIWEKINNKIIKLEQSLKMKETLMQSFEEVKQIEKSGKKPQDLIDFLNEV
jgi:DnaJ-domain-containing protein 1